MHILQSQSKACGSSPTHPNCLVGLGKLKKTGLASILKAVLSPRPGASRRLGIQLDPHQAYESMKKFVTRQGSPRLLSQENDFEKRYEANPTLRRVVWDINKIENEIERVSSPRRQLETIVTDLFSGGKTTTSRINPLKSKLLLGQISRSRFCYPLEKNSC